MRTTMMVSGFLAKQSASQSQSCSNGSPERLDYELDLVLQLVLDQAQVGLRCPAPDADRSLSKTFYQTAGVAPRVNSDNTSSGTSES